MLLATDGLTVLKVDLVAGEVKLQAKVGGRFSGNASFSADGTTMAVSRGDTVQIINMRNLVVTTVLPIKKLVQDIEFSPDGKRVFVGSSNRVGQWDIATRREINGFNSEGLGKLFTISPDGKMLASARKSGYFLTVFNIPGSSAAGSLPSAALRLATPVRAKAPIGDIEEGETEGPGSGAQPRPEFFRGVRNLVWDSGVSVGSVYRLTVSPKGLVYVGRSDSSIQVFDWRKARQIDARSSRKRLVAISAMAIGSDGAKLLIGGYTGRIDVWEIGDDGKLTPHGELTGHEKEVTSISISPDGQFSFCGDRDKKVRLWGLESGKQLVVVDGFKYPVCATGFSEDGTTAYATDGMTLVKVNTKTSKVIGKGVVNKNRPQTAVFSNDGKLVAISLGSKIGVFDTASFGEITTIKCSGNQTAVQFSPGGQYLFGGSGPVIAQWDWRAGLKIEEFDVGNNTFGSFAISRDGLYLSTPSGIGSNVVSVFKIPQR
jgi:WD40 repeat protein